MRCGVAFQTVHRQKKRCDPCQEIREAQLKAKYREQMRAKRSGAK